MAETKISATDRRATKALLEYLRRPEYTPLTQRQLLQRMQITPARRPRLERLIRRLLRDGTIVEDRTHRLAASVRGEELVGTLHRHRDGYGFVVRDDPGPDLYVAPRNLGTYRSGQRVVARAMRRQRGRLEGVILRELERERPRLLGLFAADTRGGTVWPFDAAIDHPVHVPESFRGGARDRQVVSLEMLRGPDGGRGALGKIVEVRGHLDDPGMDVFAVAHSYGLPLEFPEPVARAARQLPVRVGPRQASGRRRIDEPPAVTIDGETAKDFDDAIAVQRLGGGGFRLFVHIADVAHFVEPESALDLEARRRGTSVYFPGRVLPMFPEELSNGICSLRPGVDRLVQSVILDFDRQGRRRKCHFRDGLIRSAARLTYAQAEMVIAGATRVPGVPTRVVPMLLVADELRSLLEQRRRRRGSIDFDLPEPRILLDVEGAMTGVTVEARNRAHRMIEEFMLAANEAVADYLSSQGATCMFRVHDPPDPAKLEALIDFVEELGLQLPREPARITPLELQRLLNEVEERPEAPVVRTVALRTMKQARYSMENVGHFGLAAETYAHFTSPIRRYPDLVVHRLLRATRAGDLPGPQLGERLEPLAESCSRCERNAEAAERELLQWKKVAFIEDELGEVYHGVVTGVAGFGLFVQLEANLVEGLLRVERLGPEFFEFDPTRLTLRGTRSGKAYRLGTRLDVRVARVDRVRRRVDFSLPDEAGKLAGRPHTKPRAVGQRRRRGRSGRGAGRRRR